MESNEKSGISTTPFEGLATKRLSRRDLLGQAGQGALGLAVLALLGGGGAALATPRTRLERLLPGAREIRPNGRGGPGPIRIQDVTALGSIPSLPMWGDGQNFDQPQYYETLCVGDVDGDGQDELLIRGPAGFLVERFDPQTGQWFTLTTAGPELSDSNGWNVPQNYQTFDCVDMDGDGLDEIVGRGIEGLEAYKYDSATRKFVGAAPRGPFGDVNDATWRQEAHYSTIKWGDAKGNGIHWVVGRAPGGIVTWYYDLYSQVWYVPYFGFGPWPDNDTTNGTDWALPQYYETIQFADIDGDGQEELLGRSASGLEVYKFSKTDAKWEMMYGNGGILGDAGGWNQPQYYRTIQCADIDGDGKKEVIARSAAGIVAWRWNASTSAFDALANGPAWSDSAYWPSAQYYSTIRFGDIDGDGAEEMIGRYGSGIQTWKYWPGGGDYWSQIAGANASQPAWTDDGSGADANGAKWDEVQYYSTIRLARTLPNPQNYWFWNPNTAPTHDGTGGPRSGPYATLIGRDKYGVQTWRYQQNDYFRENGGYWSRTSAPLPDFTSASADPNQAAAYKAIDTQIRKNNSSGNIRDTYNDTTADFATWMGQMYTMPLGTTYSGPYIAPTAATPTGIDPTAWNQVTWQIYWEMNYVQQVNKWFADTAGLLDTITIGQILSIQTVGDLMSIPATSNNTVAMSILSLVFNAGWAVLGFPGIAAETEFAALPGQLSAISGLLSTACSADATFGGAGASWQGAYADLQTALTNAFSSAVTNNADLNYAITGGGTQQAYQPGDFGLMAGIGQQMLSAGSYNPWTWPSKTDEVAHQVAHNYAIQIWQSIIPASGWLIGYAGDGSVSNPPYGYNYATDDYKHPRNPYWLASGPPPFFVGSDNKYAPNQDKLFNTPTVGAIWPLGVPESDVFEANNGWPTLGTADFDPVVNPGPRDLNPPLPSLYADVRLHVTLTRDAATGQIEAALRLKNTGLSAATNLEFVSATLGSRSAIEPLPHHRTRLADGKKWTARVVFPANAGLAGQTVVLRLKGKYKGGSFGGSFRVKLP